MPTKPDALLDPRERDDILRKHLLELLDGKGAHLTFDSAVAGLAVKWRGAKLAGQPHTPWRLVEHIRLAQWDILEFIRNPKHRSPAWPQGYWPQEDALASAATWTRSLTAYRVDLADLKALVADPSADLLRPLPHGEGQTLAREAMLAADHTAYHLGQLVMLRRLLGVWND